MPEPIRDTERPARKCSHKFVESAHCLKCGWVPPQVHLSGDQSAVEVRREIQRAELERLCLGTVPMRHLDDALERALPLQKADPSEMRLVAESCERTSEQMRALAARCPRVSP
jgi:hypothetical protein